MSSSQRLGTNGNYSLIFETNGSDRGRITGGGNWGIGTIDPTAKLHINSTVSGQLPFRVQTLGTTRFLITSSGIVGIGTTSPNSLYRLDVVSSGPDQNGINTSGFVGLNVVSNGVSGDGVRSYTYGGANYAINGVSANSFGVYGRTDNADSYAGYFSGNVYTTGSYLPSDIKLKQNITEARNATSILNQLKPKNYEYKTDGSFAQMNLPQGKQFGLLSQDVEKILPGLVKDVHLDAAKHSANNGTASAQDKEALDFKAVNYTGLIPIMIQAMQEQEAKMQAQEARNKEQEAKINALTEKIAKLEAGNSTGSTINLTPADLMGVSLEQNYPNPTASKTTFRYTVPGKAKARILIYNSTSGKLVKTLPAPAKGQIDMDTSDLEAGTYIYTLEVNGNLTAAKQLMLSK